MNLVGDNPGDPAPPPTATALRVLSWNAEGASATAVKQLLLRTAPDVCCLQCVSVPVLRDVRSSLRHAARPYSVESLPPPGADAAGGGAPRHTHAVLVGPDSTVVGGFYEGRLGARVCAHRALGDVQALPRELAEAVACAVHVRHAAHGDTLVASAYVPPCVGVDRTLASFCCMELVAWLRSVRCAVGNAGIQQGGDACGVVVGASLHCAPDDPGYLYATRLTRALPQQLPLQQAVWQPDVAVGGDAVVKTAVCAIGYRRPGACHTVTGVDFDRPLGDGTRWELRSHGGVLLATSATCDAAPTGLAWQLRAAAALPAHVEQLVLKLVMRSASPVRTVGVAVRCVSFGPRDAALPAFTLASAYAAGEAVGPRTVTAADVDAFRASVVSVAETHVVVPAGERGALREPAVTWLTSTRCSLARTATREPLFTRVKAPSPDDPTAALDVSDFVLHSDGMRPVGWLEVGGLGDCVAASAAARCAVHTPLMCGFVAV